MPGWFYNALGRLTWWALPKVLRRWLGANREKVAAAAVVGAVVVAGIALARTDPQD
jgi:hypothetical protein